MTLHKAHQKYRGFLTLCIALSLLLFPGAARTGGQFSTLTLDCRYVGDNGVAHYMAGDVYALYLIANADVISAGKETTITYTTAPGFADWDRDWAALNADELHRAALALAEAAGAAGPAYTVTIGANGRGGISGLPNGFYLCVRETVPARNAAYEMSPFLFGSIIIEKGTAYYELTVTPKFEGPDPEKPPPPPTAPTSPPTPPGPTTPSGSGRPDYDDGYGRIIYRDRYIDGDGDGGDGDAPTVTVTSPTTPLLNVPPNTTPLQPLPQTGQLKWPVPVLIVAGVLLFLTGFELRYGERRQDDKD